MLPLFTDPTFQSSMEERRQRQLQEEQTRKAEELPPDCTFKPQINKGSSGTRAKSSRSTAERLYKEAEARNKRREAAKKALEHEEVQSHSFRPAINPDTDAILDMSTYRPLHTRIGSLQRAKSESLQRARMESEISNPDLTFQPQINAHSERMAVTQRRAAGELSITRRMANQTTLSQRRRLEKQREWQEKFAEEHTFAPALSKTTDDRMTSSAGFLERQREFQKRKREKLERAARKEDEECTFHPAIGNADDILVHTRPTRLGETKEEMVERLSKHEKERIDRAREAMKEQYYSQFSYKPEIDALSKELGRALTVEEHHASAAASRNKMRLMAEKAAREREECTFKPELIPAPKSVKERAPLMLRAASDPDQVAKRVDEYMKEREERLAAARRELEYKQLKDCTFEPARASSVAQPDGPVVVRGLGRYLENKDLARRIEQDRKAREAEAFSVRGATKSVPGAPTVPEPFNLSTDPRGKARQAKIAQQAREHELRECTFRPQTTEGANRQLLQQLLAEEDISLHLK